MWKQHDGVRLHLLETPLQLWTHQIREGLRDWMFRRAATREDLRGMKTIDRVATMSLYKNATGKEAGALRTIPGGGVPVAFSLRKRRILDDDRCPFCGALKETLCHRWWECSFFEGLRFQRGIWRNPDWPEALVNCGIVESTHMEAGNVVPEGRGGWDHKVEHARQEDWVDFYTDSGAHKHENLTLSQSTWAVVSRNLEGQCTDRSVGRLEGALHTNQRAELRAFLEALKSKRKARIKTDSQYSIDQVVKLVTPAAFRYAPTLAMQIMGTCLPGSDRYGRKGMRILI